MQAEQAQAEELLLVDEVADVRAGEAGARGAGAVLVERPSDRAAKRALRRLSRPSQVSAEPVRAVRVGRTQSNMSTPRSITSRMPSGSPMPMK